MITYEELFGFMKSYSDSLEQYQELTDRLLLPGSHEEWLKILEERSQVARETFRRNEEWIPRIYAGMKNMDKETAVVYYKAVYCLVLERKGCYDYSLMIDMLESVVPFFENGKTPVIAVITGLYNLLSVFYANYYDIMLEEMNSGRTRYYLEKITSYRNRYTELTGEIESDAKYDIWRAYTNLFGIVATDEKISFETLAGWYDEMEALWNSDAVQQMDKEDEGILAYLEDARVSFLMTSFEKVRQRLKKAKKAEYKDCVKDIEEKCRPLLERMVSERHDMVYYFRCYLDVVNGKRDAAKEANQALEELEAVEFAVTAKECGEEYYRLLGDIITKLEYFVTLCETAEFDEKKQLMNRMLRVFLQRVKDLPSNYNKGVMDAKYMTVFCCVLPFLDTFREKEEVLQKLVISRQPQTFIHSCMAGRLAVMVAEVILMRKPEIFVGIPAFETPEKLLGKREEFLTYIEKCGLFHDIGKCNIAGVINMQTHKITDQEFSCIKRHPSCGVDVLENDPDFAPYFPVILGHHKTYDGTRGYPADFDVLSSPYKPVIDLICICDSLDAATDHLGRNYNKVKSFDVVLEEFRQGAGSRYNPDIVRVIEEDADLQRKMSYLVTDGRPEAYYEAYRLCQKYAEMTL